MAETPKAATVVVPQPEVQNRRTHLNRVIIDTPALLNMVKHCREVEAGAAQGYVMGVM